MKKLSLFIAVVLIAVTLLPGCQVVNNSYVATVNGEKITVEEFMYYLEMSKGQILNQVDSSNQPDFWNTAEFEGKKAGEAAKEKALKEIIDATVLAQKSKADGNKLDSTAQIEINKQKQNFGTADQYQKTLKNYELTDNGVTLVLQKNYLANLVAKKWTVEAGTPTDAQILDYYNTKYVRAKHILIFITDPNTGKPLDEKVAEATANEVLAKVKAGGDFDALMKEYSQDPGLATSPNGYTFATGSMTPEFEKVAFALNVGQVSELVRVLYGFHIIKKEPLIDFETYKAEDAADAAATTKISDTITGLISNDLITSKIAELVKAAKIVNNQGTLDKIKVKTIAPPTPDPASAPPASAPATAAPAKTN